MILEVIIAIFFGVLRGSGNDVITFSWFFGGVMWALALANWALNRKLDWVCGMLVSEKMMIMDMQSRRNIIYDIEEAVKLKTPQGAICSMTHAEYVKAMNRKIRQKKLLKSEMRGTEELAEPDTPIKKNNSLRRETTGDHSQPLLSPAASEEVKAVPWFQRGVAKHFVDVSNKHEDHLKRELALKPPYDELNAITDRNAFGKFFLGRLPDKHEGLFWLDHQGPEAIHAFIRLTMLLLAMYLPAQVFLLVDIYKDWGDMDNVACISHIIVLFLPVFVAFHHLTHCMQKQVVCTNIELMRKKHVVNEVKGHQRTKKVLALIKMINSLRNQARLAIIVSQMDTKTTQTDGSANIESDWKTRMNQSRRREIEKTFDFFDEDRSGALDATEMLEFFKSLGEKDMDVQQVQKLCEALDHDGDGTVSKEEFLQWMYLSEKEKLHQSESIEEVSEKMFKMFCPDGEEEMTPQQFKVKLASLGQNIAEDDFQTFIRELDPNNDGSISVTEFQEMLERNHYTP